MGTITTNFGNTSLIEEAKRKLGLIIKDNAITTNKIKDGAVTESKIADGAVTTSKIEDYAVTGKKIMPGSITADKYSPTSIITGAINDGAVTEEKIRDKAISTNKLKNWCVTSDKLTDGAVITPVIADKAVTKGKLADGSITLEKLSDNLKEYINSIGQSKASSQQVFFVYDFDGFPVSPFPAIDGDVEGNYNAIFGELDEDLGIKVGDYAFSEAEGLFKCLDPSSYTKWEKQDLDNPKFKNALFLITYLIGAIPTPIFKLCFFKQKEDGVGIEVTELNKSELTFEYITK